MSDPSFSAHPLIMAGAVALVSATGCFTLYQATQPQMVVKAIDPTEAPKLDGDLSDAVWNGIEPVTVTTRHGEDLGGQGETRVQVRAAHDGRNIYLSFVWDDPTRSLQHLPLLKEDGDWHLVQTAFNEADENRFYEDRLAIMLAESGPALLGAAIHLGLRPLQNAPRPRSGRGLHYTGQDTILDVWQWNAASGGLAGWVQDDHLGPAKVPTPAQVKGEERYVGGFAPDPGPRVSELNFEVQRQVGDDGRVLPRRLPKAPPLLTPAADLNVTPGHSDEEDDVGRWGLLASQSVPYSPQADALIADGSIIPGVVIDDRRSGETNDIRSAGHWAAGRWVVEIERSLEGDDGHDVTMANGTLMWLAVFDHSQTRHTYHLRPIRLELE